MNPISLWFWILFFVFVVSVFPIYIMLKIKKELLTKYLKSKKEIENLNILLKNLEKQKNGGA